MRPSRADTAFVMTNLLRGVIQRGTGGAAAALDWPLAGKTGHGRYTDTGSSASKSAYPRRGGGWGNDENTDRRQQQRRTGATAALPICMDFMRRVYKSIRTANRTEPARLDPPGNIAFVTLAPASAKLSSTAPSRGPSRPPQPLDVAPGRNK